MPPRLSGVVDLEHFLLGGCVRVFLRGHGGREVDGLAELALRFTVEGDVELVQLDRVRLQLAALEVGAGRELVVADEGVDERVALHQDPLPAVAEEAAGRHRDQHADQRGVEDEVADFPQEAALGPQGRAGRRRGPGRRRGSRASSAAPRRRRWRPTPGSRRRPESPGCRIRGAGTAGRGCAGAGSASLCSARWRAGSRSRSARRTAGCRSRKTTPRSRRRRAAASPGSCRSPGGP